MKIAIISDTHDNTAAVCWIIDYLNEHQLDTAFHAGDIVSPGVMRRFRDHYHGHLHFVFGNNDGELSGLTQLAIEATNLTCHNRDMELTLADKKLYMNHYTSNAEAHAYTGRYNVCIGGHTHQYRIDTIGNTLLINPGCAVTQGKWQDDFEKTMSFVVLDLATLTPERIIINL